MHQQQQRQLDALRRVQDFLDSHAADVGALNDCEARTQLDDANPDTLRRANEIRLHKL